MGRWGILPSAFTVVILLAVVCGFLSTLSRSMGDVVQDALHDHADKTALDAARDFTDETLTRFDGWQSAVRTLSLYLTTLRGELSNRYMPAGYVGHAPYKLPDGYDAASVFDLDMGPRAKSHDPRRPSCTRCMVDLTASDIYVRGVFTADELRTEMASDAGLREEVEMGALLDPVLISLYNHLPNALQIFASSERATRRYPGQVSLGPTFVDRTFDPETRPWWVAAKLPGNRGEVVMTEPFQAADSGVWLVTIVISASSGRGTSVVGADFLVDTLADEVEQMQLYANGFASLVDTRTGVVLADKRWDRTSRVTIDTLAPGLDMALVLHGSGTTRWDEGEGETWLVAHHKPDTADFALITWVPRDEALGPASEARDKVRDTTTLSLISNVAVCTVTLVVVVGLAAVVVRSLTRPLDAVLVAARAVVSSAGELSLESPEILALRKVGGGVEVQGLATALHDCITGEGRQVGKAHLTDNPARTSAPPTMPHLFPVSELPHTVPQLRSHRTVQVWVPPPPVNPDASAPSAPPAPPAPVYALHPVPVLQNGTFAPGPEPMEVRRGHESSSPF